MKHLTPLQVIVCREGNILRYGGLPGTAVNGIRRDRERTRPL